jgi:cardiolipin synthase
MQYNSNSMKFTKADLLTFSRIGLTPIVLYILSMNSMKARIFGFWFFIMIALTDFLDGYYARISKTESKLGEILDPLADKWLVLSSMIFLINHKIIIGNSILIPYIVLFREIFVIGLRNIAILEKITIKSSYIGKFKTLFLMIGLGFLFFYHAQIEASQLIYKVGIGLLILGTILCIISCTEYFIVFIKKK